MKKNLTKRSICQAICATCQSLFGTLSYTGSSISLSPAKVYLEHSVIPVVLFHYLLLKFIWNTQLYR